MRDNSYRKERSKRLEHNDWALGSALVYVLKREGVSLLQATCQYLKYLFHFNDHHAEICEILSYFSICHDPAYGWKIIHNDTAYCCFCARLARFKRVRVV